MKCVGQWIRHDDVLNHCAFVNGGFHVCSLPFFMEWVSLAFPLCDLIVEVGFYCELQECKQGCRVYDSLQ